MKFQKKESLWILFNFYFIYIILFNSVKFIKYRERYYLELIPNFLLKFQYKRMQFPLPRIYIHSSHRFS